MSVSPMPHNGRAHLPVPGSHDHHSEQARGRLQKAAIQRSAEGAGQVQRVLGALKLGVCPAHQTDRLLQNRHYEFPLHRSQFLNALTSRERAAHTVLRRHQSERHPQVDSAPRSRVLLPRPGRSSPSNLLHCDQDVSQIEYLDPTPLLLRSPRRQLCLFGYTPSDGDRNHSVEAGQARRRCFHRRYILRRIH